MKLVPRMVRLQLKVDMTDGVVDEVDGREINFSPNTRWNMGVGEGIVFRMW